jgi:hypothetical protein
MNSNCSNIFFSIKKEVNSPLKADGKQPSKKRPNIPFSSISKFFVAKEPFKKDDLQRK